MFLKHYVKIIKCPRCFQLDTSLFQEEEINMGKALNIQCLLAHTREKKAICKHTDGLNYYRRRGGGG